jgi:hypothetical protein
MRTQRSSDDPEMRQFLTATSLASRSAFKLENTTLLNQGRMWSAIHLSVRVGAELGKAAAGVL